MTPGTDYPFGAPGGGRSPAVRLAMLIGLPLLALVGVYAATRGEAAAPAVEGHDHAAMLAASTTDVPEPVELSAADARRIGVTYAPVTEGPLDREIRTVGQVTFDETRVRTIAPKIDGWVERLHIDFTGQAVRAGAPMLAVYSPMLVAAQEELLLAARLEADVAQGSATARANAAELRASARRRLAWWDVPETVIARIERDGEVQRTVTLHAPVSGFVVEKSVLEGQRIMAGDALYRVADLAVVWVEGEIYEQDLAAVRLGQRVDAELQALPAERFAGRITYIYPTIDPETRTARVRVELANPRLALKPGMYATLRVAGAGRALTLSVPRSAVLSTGERHLVFVRAPDGTLAPRLVEIGMATDDRIEVRGGLSAGEMVVASATFLLDAESNLRTLLGGAAAPAPGDAAPAASPAPGAAAPMDHSRH